MFTAEAKLHTGEYLEGLQVEEIKPMEEEEKM